MGLDKPVLEQFVIYVKNVLHGDLGHSYFTNSEILDDLLKRFPATFELITLSIILALVLGLILGMFSATRPQGIASRISRVYGMLAGSFADFWLALILYISFCYIKNCSSTDWKTGCGNDTTEKNYRNVYYGQYSYRKLGVFCKCSKTSGASCNHTGCDQWCSDNENDQLNNDRSVRF